MNKNKLLKEFNGFLEANEIHFVNPVKDDDKNLILDFIFYILKAQRKKHIEIIKKKAHKDKDCGTLKEPACGVNQTLKEIIKQIK